MVGFVAGWCIPDYWSDYSLVLVNDLLIVSGDHGRFIITFLIEDISDDDDDQDGGMMIPQYQRPQ